MGIFTLDERTGIVALGIAFTIGVIVVHGTENICLAILSCLLILHRATGVDTLYPVVHPFEIWSIASLIAHTPDDDARMIAQGEHITLVAFKVHLLKVSALGQCTFAITHAMALQISLCYNVDACRVAQIIPAGVVGIVGRTNGIDVQPLHDANVLTHTFC